MIAKAKYMGVPIFYDTDSGEIEGRNSFYDILLGIVIPIDLFVIWVAGLFGIELLFEIKIDKEQ